MTANKLQTLLIKHLQKHGSVKLLLPDEMVIEIGVNQVDSDGALKPVENYCWVMASRDDKMAVLDKYNLGVRFADEKTALVFEDQFVTSEGRALRRLDVV